MRLAFPSRFGRFVAEICFGLVSGGSPGRLLPPSVKTALNRSICFFLPGRGHGISTIWDEFFIFQNCYETVGFAASADKGISEAQNLSNIDGFFLGRNCFEQIHSNMTDGWVGSSQEGGWSGPLWACRNIVEFGY